VIDFSIVKKWFRKWFRLKDLRNGILFTVKIPGAECDRKEVFPGPGRNLNLKKGCKRLVSRFRALLQRYQLKLTDVFGNYQLKPFDPQILNV
jgi:hypothetical protein